MKPLIGVTSAPRPSAYPGEPDDDTAPMAYGEVVAAAGGIAVIVPAYLDLDDDLFARLDGVIITGGGDVEPSRYGRATRPETTGVDRRRDEVEIELIRRAASSDLPLVAICRGIQVLTVALGGTLLQDVAEELPGALRHMDQERPMQGSHSVEIDPRCELAPMVGGRQPLVNSLHHQGVEDPGPDLRAVAWAPDGLIEAVELPGNRFFYGVQWHPELLGVDAPTFGMFAAFVQACDRDAADGHTAASDGRARATGAAAARQTRSK